jgi:cell shape-determining protein MreD
MNGAAFALMALGYFTGNVASNRFIFDKPWQGALIVGGISTLLWVVLFGGYLYYSQRKKL